MSGGARIAIGIATFKRPKGLLRLLRSLERLDTDAQIRIIVTDNDAAGREGEACATGVSRQGYRWPIDVSVTERRGISEARNTLLQRAFIDPDTSALVMVDDDQWVEPDWITSLLEMQRLTNADVVGCRVVPDFQGEPSEWTEGLYVYWADKLPDGRCGLITGTGGTLLARSVLAHGGSPGFDPRFSLTGGGDKEFFVRLSRQGAAFAYAGTAVAHEIVDRSRLNIGWALNRAYRIGATDMRIIQLHSNGLKPLLLEPAKIAAGLAISLVCCAATLGSPKRRIGPLMKLYRALGKASAFFGRQYDEYQTIHGS